jgi:hypothetical protein
VVVGAVWLGVTHSIAGEGEGGHGVPPVPWLPWARGVLVCSPWRARFGTVVEGALPAAAQLG